MSHIEEIEADAKAHSTPPALADDTLAAPRGNDGIVRLDEHERAALGDGGTPIRRRA